VSGVAGSTSLSNYIVHDISCTKLQSGPNARGHIGEEEQSSYKVATFAEKQLSVTNPDH
jgi:hypothetical protein